MKSLKRILCSVLCCCLAALSLFQASASTVQTVSLSVSSIYNVAPGQRTSFDVTIGNLTNMPTTDGGYQIEIELPVIASFVSIERDGEVLSEAEEDFNLYNYEDADGNIVDVIILADYEAELPEEIKWTVDVFIDYTADMGYYPIGFYSTPAISDGNFELVDLDIKSGAIVLGKDEQNLLGDTDGDGVVLGSDLIPMRKQLLSLENLEFFEENADMNIDGYVNLKDLVRLKKNLVENSFSFNDTKISDTAKYLFEGNGYAYAITADNQEVIAFADKNANGGYDYIDTLGGAGKFQFADSAKTSLLTYNGIKEYSESVTDAGTELTVVYDVSNENATVSTTYLFHENGIKITAFADLGSKCIASGKFDREFLNRYIKTDKKINYNWVYPTDGNYPYQEYESIATVNHFNGTHLMYTFNRDANSPTYHYLKNYPEEDFKIYGINDTNADGIINANESISGYTMDYDLVFTNPSDDADYVSTALFGGQQSDVSVKVNLPEAQDDNSTIFVGDSVSFDIAVKNLTDSASAYTLSYDIMDYYGKKVAEHSVTDKSIAANEKVLLPIEIDGQYGMYYLNLTFSCGDFSYVEYYPFALLKEYDYSDTTTHFGINALHSNTVYEENTAVSLCDKLGIDIVRVGVDSLRIAKKLSADGISVYAQYGKDFSTQENIDEFVKAANKMKPYAEWFTFANEYDTNVKSNNTTDAETVAKAQTRMDEFKANFYNESAIAAFKANNLPISWNPTCHGNSLWFKLMNDEGIWANSDVIDTHMYSITKIPDVKYHYNGVAEMYCNENSLARLKAAAEAYGDDKTFVIGETGYYTTELDLRTHADLNTRTGILSLAYGADIVNYYCMFDRTSYFTGTSDWNEMHFGAFYNYDFYGVTKPKPWAAAYGNMTGMLNGVESVQMSDMDNSYYNTNGQQDGTLRVFDVTMKNGETMVAAWSNIYAVPGTTSNTLGNNAKVLPWENQWLDTEAVTFDAVGDTVTVIDTMGNSTEYAAVNGQVTIQLSGSPVYIKGVK